MRECKEAPHRPMFPVNQVWIATTLILREQVEAFDRPQCRSTVKVWFYSTAFCPAGVRLCTTWMSHCGLGGMSEEKGPHISRDWNRLNALPLTLHAEWWGHNRHTMFIQRFTLSPSSAAAPTHPGLSDGCVVLVGDQWTLMGTKARSQWGKTSFLRSWLSLRIRYELWFG